MKKLKITIPLLLLSMLLIRQLTVAQIKVFIPDTDFRDFLNTSYPACMDFTGDSLIIDSAGTITGILDCSHQNISDLSGIEYFTDIAEIYCYGNNVTYIPELSNITDLQMLDCENNELTSLPDLAALASLRRLFCAGNHLTNLPDLSANTVLENLHCDDNQLSNLPDLSANTALVTISCDNSQLAVLPDLSNNTLLLGLFCDNNLLTGLPDLSANTSLLYLECANNQLTSLPDLTANISLRELSCYGNRLTSLPDLSPNDEFWEIYCNDNLITSLPDLSAFSDLENFHCFNNKLDFSDTKSLRIADTLSDLKSFIYAPQNPFGTANNFNLEEGDTLILSINGQDSASGYQWFKDNLAVEDATDTILLIPHVTIANSGTYTCRSYGTALENPPMIWGPGISEFTSEPFNVIITNGTGINYYEYIKNLKIYPNPNTGYFTIAMNITQKENLELKIISCIGQEIFREKLNQFTGIYLKHVDLSNYPAGIYNLRIMGSKGVFTEKVIIERANN